MRENVVNLNLNKRYITVGLSEKYLSVNISGENCFAKQLMEKNGGPYVGVTEVDVTNKPLGKTQMCDKPGMFPTFSNNGYYGTKESSARRFASEVLAWMKSGAEIKEFAFESTRTMNMFRKSFMVVEGNFCCHSTWLMGPASTASAASAILKEKGLAAPPDYEVNIDKEFWYFVFGGMPIAAKELAATNDYSVYGYILKGKAYLVGNTFPHRKFIKEQGFEFNKAAKVWVRKDTEGLLKLIREINTACEEYKVKTA